MIETCRTVSTTPERVFAVLADGWSYASWVVGAAHIRDVDAGWPAVGTRVHHRVGLWPLHINDQTVVRAVETGKTLELDAQMWPLGAAMIRIWLEPVSATSTRIHMAETLTSGIGRLLPDAVQSLLLRPRNAEALRRLDDIAVHRESR
ncbi:SRPBCC family protein [Actinoplanes sp. NPDC051513]|uniref:SRPBCC family protein n=1 Tax=Actinoplanes sp. NPDC051513 TaxID=3363908 RepID=UPI003793A2E8